MKLTALVTLYPGPVRPGETLDMADADQAKALIARGLAAPASDAKASAPAPAPAPAADADADTDAARSGRTPRGSKADR